MSRNRMGVTKKHVRPHTPRLWFDDADVDLVEHKMIIILMLAIAIVLAIGHIMGYIVF